MSAFFTLILKVHFSTLKIAATIELSASFGFLYLIIFFRVRIWYKLLAGKGSSKSPHLIIISLLARSIEVFSIENAPLTIKFLNGLLGVLVGLWIYYFIRDSIPCQAAKWGLMLCLFFPSLLLWSITGLKDTFCMFLIVMVLFLSKSIVKRYKLLGFLILMFSMFLKKN